MQGYSIRGACAAKCSKFDFEKFENSIMPLKGACAPMRDNRVAIFNIIAMAYFSLTDYFIEDVAAIKANKVVVLN